MPVFGESAQAVDVLEHRVDDDVVSLVAQPQATQTAHIEDAY